MRKTLGLVLLGIWAVLSIGILGQFLFDSAAVAGSPDRPWVIAELEVRLTWGLMILNFPSSLLVALAGSSLPGGSGAGPTLEWGVLTLAGLVQWTLLMPALGQALRPLLARLRPRPTP